MLTIEIGLEYSEIQNLSQQYPPLKFSEWQGNMVRVTGTQQNLHTFLSQSYTVDASEIEYIFEFQTV